MSVTVFPFQLFILFYNIADWLSFYRASKQTLKGIGTTLLLLCSFIVLYLPITAVYYSGLKLVESTMHTVMMDGLSVLVSMTAIIDVMIYGCRDIDVRVALKLSSPRNSRLDDSKTEHFYLIINNKTEYVIKR